VGLLTDLFPSALFGAGGDEINARFYQVHAQTQHDLDGRILEQALDAFSQVTHEALNGLWKIPVDGRYLMPVAFFVLKRPMRLRG
jgi:hexosaminidase